MTIMQLIYFERIVSVGHLTQVAAELMIAQPSLTQSMNKLEQELGFPLFEKVGRRLVLTREGRDFHMYAEKAVKAFQTAEAAAERIFQENRGVVRFSHTEPLPKAFIPGLISSFLEREENRKVRIEADIAGSAKVIEQLRGDMIDFGFCSYEGEEPKDLELYPLFRHPIVLIASRKDPLCRCEAVEPEDLLPRPCISYGANSAMQELVHGFWRKLGMEPDVRYRSSAVAISGLVAQGLGWAFVALTDGIPDDEEIAVLNMPKLNLERTVYLAARKRRIHSAAARRFRDYVISFSREWT